MSDTVIKVENLSVSPGRRPYGPEAEAEARLYEPEAKQYRIGAKEGYRTFCGTLPDAAQRFLNFFNRKSQFTNRNLSGSVAYAPISMPSSLCDEHERKRVYRFAEQIRGSGLSISCKKRTKLTHPLK